MLNDSERKILEKIRNLRNQKGFSQTRVAESIGGITQSGYAKIERGDTENIPLSVAVGIAKALDVGFNDLFNIDGDSQRIESLNGRIETLREMIDEGKIYIRQLSILIETAQNEKSHIKEHLVMQMASDYSFNIGLIDTIISRSENEVKEYFVQKKEDVIRIFNLNKDYYLKTGFLTQSDFDDHFKAMEGIYQNKPIL
jgi:transcriptional regulator with XRE-family HTH domain